MSKNNIKTIEYQLDILNRQIDMKIITGRPYRKEALRHKSLLAELRHLKARQGYSFFGRLSHALAMFVF